jgi:adenylylsulfate kinase
LPIQRHAETVTRLQLSIASIASRRLADNGYPLWRVPSKDSRAPGQLSNHVRGTLMTSSNVVWHPPSVSRADRERRHGHPGAVIWFTGLSGSGKSTLAHAVDVRLFNLGIRSYVLDGDNVRHGLCKDLSFSRESRSENIRRIGEAARLFVDAGMVLLTAFISPYRADRDRVRTILDPGDFIEIYCNCPLEVCEARDVKGMYRRARAGEIPEFTGISAPYEQPPAPNLIIDTSKVAPDAAAEAVLLQLRERGIVGGLVPAVDSARGQWIYEQPDHMAVAGD